MKFKQFGLVLAVFIAINSIAQEKKYKLHTVAFYNFENLFDTIKGPNYDEEYLPVKGWTSKNYNKKLEKEVNKQLQELREKDKHDILILENL